MRRQGTLRCGLLGALCVLAELSALPLGAGAAATSSDGAVCIAGFRIRHPHDLVMDLPAPGDDSHYSFRLDKKLDATVGKGEMRLVEGLATDRRVLVEVRLDGRRTEAFWIDLRKHDQRRVCLWLYEDYWHWCVTEWDDRDQGCRCWPDEQERGGQQ